jgi:hypothetical protein
LNPTRECPKLATRKSLQSYWHQFPPLPFLFVFRKRKI